MKYDITIIHACLQNVLFFYEKWRKVILKRSGRGERNVYIATKETWRQNNFMFAVVLYTGGCHNNYKAPCVLKCEQLLELRATFPLPQWPAVPCQQHKSCH
jgi:hypothetical protein